MLKLLWPFKKYVRSDGGERGYTKNMRKRIGEEGLAKVYVIHILLRECFHISTALFLFLTSLMGKWKLKHLEKLLFILLLIWLPQDM